MNYLLWPLIIFHLLLVLAFMLHYICTKQILKSVTLFSIFAKRISRAWKSLTTATVPILKCITSNVNFFWISQPHHPIQRSVLILFFCHVSTSTVTHPQLVLDSGFSMAITMPDILEKSFPCDFEAYIVYVLGLKITKISMCSRDS